MPSLFLLVDLFWYGGLGALSLVVIYFLFWQRGLMDITRKQLLLVLPVGTALAALLSAIRYIQFMSQPFSSYLFSVIFEIYLLVVCSFGIVFTVYFRIAGRQNLMKTYNFDINGKSNREIKRLKELHK
jgi:hypothetical protein